jgi:peroxiredoxin
LAGHHATVIAIVVDNPATNAALVKRLGLEFAVLSDPELATIRAWGVEHEGKDIALPATLVVDRSGMIAWAYVGDNVGDRPVLDTVLEVLTALEHDH